ncbi:hypothetical protein [Paraburkholderia sediminicola]|uniref:hypothetical protein n=1 Tax=Paraburkholderia sediminicola TaxID=458836 RepID=UPI0038BA0A8D
MLQSEVAKSGLATQRLDGGVDRKTEAKPLGKRFSIFRHRVHRVFFGQYKNGGLTEPFAEFDHVIDKSFSDKAFDEMSAYVTAPHSRTRHPRVDRYDRNARAGE